MPPQQQSSDSSSREAAPLESSSAAAAAAAEEQSEEAEFASEYAVHAEVLGDEADGQEEEEEEDPPEEGTWEHWEEVCTHLLKTCSGKVQPSVLNLQHSGLQAMVQRYRPVMSSNVVAGVMW